MGLEFKTDTSGNPIPRVPEGSSDTKGLLHNSKNEIEVPGDGGGGSVQSVNDKTGVVTIKEENVNSSLIEVLVENGEYDFEIDKARRFYIKITEDTDFSIPDLNVEESIVFNATIFGNYTPTFLGVIYDVDSDSYSKFNINEIVFDCYKRANGQQTNRVFIKNQELLNQGLFEGCILYYKFENTTGEVVDSSINSLNPVDSNVNRGINGIIGNGFGFNGSTSQLTTPSTSSLNLVDNQGNDNPFTIRLWLNLNDNSDQTFLVKTQQNGNPSYIVRMLSQKLQFRTYSTDNIWKTYLTNDILDLTSSWNHIVITSDGTNYFIYVNGVIKSNTFSPNGVYTTRNNSNSPLTIGNNYFNNTQYTNGLIDEVCIIHNNYWSDSQVVLDYNNGSGTTI